MVASLSLPPTHSHVHLLPVARVVTVHGALDDLRGQVTGGPADLCRNSYYQGRSAGATWKKKVGRNKMKQIVLGLGLLVLANFRAKGRS